MSTWRPVRFSASTLGWLVAAVILALPAVGWRWLNRDPVYAPKPRWMPEPNGFDTLVAAGRLLQEKRRFWDFRRGEPTPQATAHLLSVNRDALRLARAGLKQEYRERRQLSYTAVFPHYSDFEALADLLLYQSQAGFAAGSTDSAFDDAVEAMRLGGLLRQGADLVGASAGRRIHDRARAWLWRMAASLDARGAASGARRLEAIDERRVPWPQILAEQAETELGSLHELFARADWRTNLRPLGIHDSEAQLQLSWLLCHERSAFERRRAWYARAEQAAALPYRAQMEAFADLATDPRNRHPTDQIPCGNWPDLMVDALDEAIDQAGTRLLFTDLALRAYRLERGRAAPNLEALVAAGYLQRVPLDPFDGLPLRYADGRLWSIGPDTTDNGGRAIVTKGLLDCLGADSRGDLVAGVHRP